MGYNASHVLECATSLRSSPCVNKPNSGTLMRGGDCDSCWLYLHLEFVSLIMLLHLSMNYETTEHKFTVLSPSVKVQGKLCSLAYDTTLKTSDSEIHAEISMYGTDATVHEGNWELKTLPSGVAAASQRRASHCCWWRKAWLSGQRGNTSWTFRNQKVDRLNLVWSAFSTSGNPNGNKNQHAMTVRLFRSIGCTIEL